MEVLDARCADDLMAPLLSLRCGTCTAREGGPDLAIFPLLLGERSCTLPYGVHTYDDIHTDMIFKLQSFISPPCPRLTRASLGPR